MPVQSANAVPAKATQIVVDTRDITEIPSANPSTIPIPYIAYKIAPRIQRFVDSGERAMTLAIAYQPTVSARHPKHVLPLRDLDSVLKVKRVWRVNVFGHIANLGTMENQARSG